MVVVQRLLFLAQNNKIEVRQKVKLLHTLGQFELVPIFVTKPIVAGCCTE